MPAGTLDRLVTLLSPPPGQDALGQPLLSPYVEQGQVWASIRTMGGLETIRAGLQTAVTKVSIRIRRHDTVAANWRVQDGTVMYEIKDGVPPNNQRGPWMDLVCEVVR